MYHAEKNPPDLSGRAYWTVTGPRTHGSRNVFPAKFYEEQHALDLAAALNHARELPKRRKEIEG